jgi:hypothetical protein
VRLGEQSVGDGSREEAVTGVRVLVADDDEAVRSLYVSLLGRSCRHLFAGRRLRRAMRPCSSRADCAARSQFSTSTCRASTASKRLFFCGGTACRHASPFTARIPKA